MRVFVTGATGFVGSAVVQELLKAGHEVTGLARNDANAKALLAAGAKVHRGDLEDTDSLHRGAAESEGVIHCGFVHDFARFKEVCEIDRKAIEAMSAALAGSKRSLVITSGTALVNPGTLATEEMRTKISPDAFPRVLSEQTADAWAAKGVRVSVVRLSPSVHGDGDHGFVPNLVNTAREKKMSAYIGEGQNRWTGVHRLDAAKLYRLALEKGTPGARYHGVAEEGVYFRDIAKIIGAKLNVPVKSLSHEEAQAHFTWFTHFAGLDCPASSKLTQEILGWKPTGKTLLEDLENGKYFKV